MRVVVGLVVLSWFAVGCGGADDASHGGAADGSTTDVRRASADVTDEAAADVMGTVADAARAEPPRADANATAGMDAAVPAWLDVAAPARIDAAAPAGVDVARAPDASGVRNHAGDAPLAARRTFYVAPLGDDAYAGTTAAPWRTLQHAAGLAAPGDEIMVRAGTYAGFTIEDKTGTAAAPITFRAEPGVVVDRPGPPPRRLPLNGALGRREWPRWPFGITVQQAAYVVIEGFEVTGMPAPESDGTGQRLHNGGAGVRLDVCRHVTVRKTRALRNGRWGLFSAFCDDLVIEDNEASGSQLEHGIYLSNSGDRPIVRRNVMTGNQRAGLQINADNNFTDADYAAFSVVDGVTTGALVEGNELRGNGAGGAAAINLDGVSDSVIRNNVLEGNLAQGIALFQIDGFTASQRNQITNNRIVMAAAGRFAITMVGCAGATVGGACPSAYLTAGRPRAVATGSSANVLRGNVLLSRHPTGASIRTDTASVAPDAAGATFSSDDNMVMDRFVLDAETLSLAAWRTRTGQDVRSVIAR